MGFEPGTYYHIREDVGSNPKRDIEIEFKTSV